MFYLIKQGFENIFRNKLMFIASVLIIATSMITLSIFIILGENVKYIVNNIKSSQAIIANLEDGLSEDETSNIAKKLKDIDGVAEIEYESKEQALENAKKEFFDDSNSYLTSGWEEINYFPASFTVTLSDLENSNKISEQISKITGVKKVVFDEDIFKTITKIADVVRIIVIGIFVLLVGVSFLVISNTIKLVLHSRRKEINIMKYIGATDGFVQTPFIIEGIVVGIIGSLISWGTTVTLYDALISNFGSNGLFQFVSLNFEILKINLIIGVLVSSLACVASIRRYLKV